MIGYTYESKEGKKYTKKYTCGDTARTYESLARFLVAAKINASPACGAVKRRNLYNGYVEITVYVRGVDGKAVGRYVYTIIE